MPAKIIIKKSASHNDLPKPPRQPACQIAQYRKTYHFKIRLKKFVRFEMFKV